MIVFRWLLIKYNDYNIKFTYHYTAKLGSRNQPRSAADLLENSELEHIERTLFFLYFLKSALTKDYFNFEKQSHPRYIRTMKVREEGMPWLEKGITDYHVVRTS